MSPRVLKELQVHCDLVSLNVRRRKMVKLTPRITLCKTFGKQEVERSCWIDNNNNNNFSVLLFYITTKKELAEVT